MYLLPCQCGQNVRVGRAQAGQQVTCVCGKSLTVPTLRGIQELQPAPPESAPAKGRAWTPIHGALFAAGLLAAVIGAAVAIYSVRQYAIFMNYTEDRSDVFIEYEAAHIDHATPEELLTLWNLEREHGLGRKQTMPWVAAQQSATIYRQRATIAGIVAVLGLAIAIGTVFIGRPPRT